MNAAVRFRFVFISSYQCSSVVKPFLCRAASYNTTDAATPAFKDSTSALIGIEIRASAACSTSRGNPAPSFPIKIATGSRKSASALDPPHASSRRMRTRGHNLNPSHAQLRKQHRNRHPAQNREAQRRSRRRAQRLRRPRISAPARSHQPLSRQKPPPNANRPHIPRILHRSHHHHQRRIAAQTLHPPQPPRATHRQIAIPAAEKAPPLPAASPSPPPTRTIYRSSAARATAGSPLRSRSPLAKSVPAPRSPASLTSSASASQPRPQRVLHQLRPFHANRLRPQPAPSRAAPRETSSATYSRGW